MTSCNLVLFVRLFIYCISKNFLPFNQALDTFSLRLSPQRNATHRPPSLLLDTVPCSCNGLEQPRVLSNTRHSPVSHHKLCRQLLLRTRSPPISLPFKCINLISSYQCTSVQSRTFQGPQISPSTPRCSSSIVLDRDGTFPQVLLLP